MRPGRMAEPPAVTATGFGTLRRVIQSWFFFSLSTAISVLALLKRFGHLEASGVLREILGLYIKVGQLFKHLNVVLPSGWGPITELSSLTTSGWLVICLPALVSIYKHMATPAERWWAVFWGSLLVLALLGLMLSPSDDASSEWSHSPLSALAAVFCFGLFFIALAVRSWPALLRAELYYCKNLIGALVICSLLILAGAADLA